MAIDEKYFFDHVRKTIFSGKMNQDQVDGCNVLLDAWEEHGSEDLRQCAYMLATAYHETAHTMQPIEEYGKGRGRPYGKPDPKTGKTYFGRGYVQLTWKTNYKRAGRLIGHDLVHDPAHALDPSAASEIIVRGMCAAWFTKHCLNDHIYMDKCDYRNARRIVNGTDKADMIAGYAVHFEHALRPEIQDDDPWWYKLWKALFS